MTDSFSKKILDESTVVYLDSSALMAVDQMKQFVEKNEAHLIRNRKTILVPDAVSQELTRLTTGKDPDKVRKACQALKIIREHEEIFQLEDADYSDEAVYKAFADNEILARLSYNKRYAQQLLITNDGGLSRDAYRLNEQESVFGKWISVCRLDENGELRMSKKPQREVEKVFVTKPVYIQSEPEVIEKKIYVQADPAPKASPAPFIAGIFLGWFLGYGLSRYGKHIFRSFRIR